MPVLSGTTSGSIRSEALNIPCKIKSFSVYNNAGSGTNVNTGIHVEDVSELFMFQDVLAANGSANSSAYHLTDIIVEKGAQIVIVASQSVDYYFTIENI